MEEPIACTKDRFKRLLAEWKLNNDRIWKMQDEQGDVVVGIQGAFARIVTGEQLLADLSWQVTGYPHCVELVAPYTDKAEEFLKLMEWNNFKYHDAETLQLDGHTLMIRDRDKEFSIYFETGIKAMLAFCNKQGIKPDVTALKDNYKKAKENMDKMINIIESLDS